MQLKRAASVRLGARRRRVSRKRRPPSPRSTSGTPSQARPAAPISADFFAAVGRARLGHRTRGRGHGGCRIFVRLGNGELVKLSLHCCRRRRTWDNAAVFCAPLGITWEVVAILYDTRKDLDKVAKDALPCIPRFGKPVILLNVTRPRLNEIPKTRPPFSARHGERVN